MPASIHLPEKEIAELCEAYGVERLELFGSAAGEAFDEETSDLDFVVRFTDQTRRQSGYANQYLDFARALEGIVERDIDLVTERSIQNPFFRRSVDSARQVIYDRRGEETPA